jgi:Mrp family chromosome partitioning ATPase
VDNSSFETVSLGDYFGVIWRRKWIVILVTILFGVAGFLYSMHQQKLYASTSQVLYTGVSSSSSTKGTASDWGIAQVPLAQSADFAATVLAKAKITPAMTPAQLQNETAVTAIPSGTGIQFTVTNPNENNAKTLAGTYSSQYPIYLAAHTPYKKLDDVTSALKLLRYKIANPPADATPGQKQKWATNEILLTAKQQSIKSTTDPLQLTSTSPGKPSAPVQTQPKATRTIAIGAFIGFVFGIMLAFLQDVLDTRVRSADEIGRRLRLPLLAQIPSPPRQANGELVMLADSVPALVPSTEAYRIAKLNFTGALNATGARIIMFTSAAEKDGTSPTIANLALVLARAGKHVVLVDANLRDPAQADQFGLHAPAGLADVLSGTAKLADVLTAVDVRRVGIEGGGNGRAPVDGILEIVPAGRAPYDAAELLDTRAAGELLRALAGRADIVLVDAPAILPVSDAMVLATKVDGVVVVTRAGRDSRSAVVALRRALDNCPAPGLAFIFTGASADGRNEYGGAYRGAGAPATQTPWPNEERDPRDPREIGVL